MMIEADVLWLLFSSAMVAGVLLRHPAEKLARRLAAKPVWCGLLIAAAPVLLRLALLAHHPEPTPAGADDFSYLLLSDTLAHFRLANPPHAMPRFFEANFVLQEPRYSSIFPLGQGLFLSAGQILTGHAWAGVLLSEALLCGLCYWMLLGWVSPLWALAGGWFAVCEFGPLSQWMNTYWGGAVAGIAGCLVFGALPRLRAGGVWPAVLLGGGLGLSWLTRPFETSLAALSIVLYFVMLRPFKDWRIGTRKLARTAVTVLLAAAPFAGLSLLHNRAVTGQWMTLPYMLSRAEYGVPATFTFQANPVPQRPLTPEQLLDYRAQSAIHGDGGDTLPRFASRFMDHIGLYRFFFYPPLYPALIAFLLSLRELRSRWVLATLLVFALGTNFYPYFYPHYIAVASCIFVLMSIIGLTEIGKLRVGGKMVGREAVRLVFLLYAGWFLLLYGVHLSGDKQLLDATAWYDTAHFINSGDAEGRAGINRQLAQMPGEQLVFVHYAPRHGFHEWIHNAADIDHAKVVRALDLGDSENRKLMDFYPHRNALLLEPDVWPPRLTPYRHQAEEPVPVVPTPPAKRVRTPKPEAHEFSTLPESGFIKHGR